MPMLTLRLPDVKLTPMGRPDHCPSCGWKHLMRCGTCTKPIRDPRLHVVTVQRITVVAVVTPFASIRTAWIGPAKPCASTTWPP